MKIGTLSFSFSNFSKILSFSSFGCIFLLSIFIFLFSMTFTLSAYASNDLNSNPSSKNNQFEFPENLLQEAKEQALSFQKETGSLSEEELKKTESRAADAFAKQDWAIATNEYSRLLGKHPEKREFWIHLSMAAHQKNFQEKNYQVELLAKKAAIQAYQLAKTPEEQAEALLVYGDTFNPAEDYEYPYYQYALEFAAYLSDITKLRLEHKELKDVMDFRYLKPRVNTDSSPPSACFLFSHPLETNNIHLSDYISITPAVDGIVTANGRELCMSSLQFGATYDITLKAGLQDTFGEKLKKDEKLSLKIRDQDSRLSFNAKAYILRKEENARIPLTGVNVDQVSIKVLRVSERALNFVVGQSKEFLTKLWDYRIDQIGNETGELLYEGEMDFSKERNKTVTKQIPFSEVVKTFEPGVYIIQAEEKNIIIGNKASATQWLIVSDLALTTFTQSNGGITVNVRSLKTASPLENIELRLIAHNNTVLKTLKSNDEGMAFFEPSVTTGKGGNRPLMILAYGANGSNEAKKEFSFIALDLPAFDLSDRGVAGRKAPGPLDAFLYTEQGVYRPGSTVHVDAILRNETGLLTSKIPLTFQVLRSDETLVKTWVKTGNELGFYSLEIPLFNSARTGQWTVLAFADPKKDPIGRTTFSVEEFVPSRIAVNVKASQNYLSNREPTQIDVDARYLFGSPAAGLKGDSTVILRPRANAFPTIQALANYVFGLENDSFQNLRYQEEIPALNSEGKTEYPLQLTQLPETSKPLEAVVRVTLSDQGGRPEVGSLTLPVQTTPVLIGIKALFKDRLLPEAEEEAKFEVLTVDPTGQLLAVSDLEYEFFEENLQYTWYQPENNSAWQYKILMDDQFLQRGTLASLADKPQNLNLAVKDWGQYRLEIKDPKSGAATSLRFQKGWLSLAEGADAPDKITVKANKPFIKWDETVELQIESPFEGQALLTVANNQVLETHNIVLHKNTSRISLKATEKWGLGVYCMISAIRPLSSTPTTGEGLVASQAFLPKRAIGLAWIGIDPDMRSLAVNIEVPKDLRPRQTVEIPVQVTRKDGIPVFSSPVQMTVAAVDEGILKLTDFSTPKPQDYFLGQRSLGVEQRDLYGRLIDPIPGEQGLLRQGGDAGVLSRNMQALSKRSFKIISLYKGLVQLDKKGKAQLKLELPDFNGSLRLMVVAFDDKRFGSGENTLLVRDPVVLEGVLPRFLGVGDQSSFSLSLHNVSGPSGQYQVEVKTEGEIRLKSVESETAVSEAVESDRVASETEAAASDEIKEKENEGEKAKANIHTSRIFRVALEKDGKAQLNIPIQALSLGDGKIQVNLKRLGALQPPVGEKDLTLTGKDLLPGKELPPAEEDLQNQNLNISTDYELSVRAANPYSSWSTGYLLKGLESYRMAEAFKNYLPGSAQIVLTMSSALPWDIVGLSRTLAKYAYGCIEQTTSKGLGALYTTEYAADNTQWSKDTAKAQGSNRVNQALALLSEKQLSSGAYSLWGSDASESNLFLTSYVMDFYLRSKAAGYEIPQFSLSRGLEHLKQKMERNSDLKADDLSGLAYAVYVLTKAEQIPSGTLRYIYDNYFEQLDNPLARAMIGTALAIKGENERAAQAFKLLFYTKNDLSSAGPFGTYLRNQAGLLSLSLETLHANPSLKEAAAVVETSIGEIQKELKEQGKGQKSQLGTGNRIQDSLFSTQELAWILLASNGLQAQKNQEPIQVEVNGVLKKTEETSLRMPITAAELRYGLQFNNRAKNNVFMNVSVTALPKENPKADSQGIEIEVDYYDLQGKRMDPSKVKQGTQMIVLIKGTKKIQGLRSLLIVDLLPAGFEIENARINSENKPYEWLPELSKLEFSEARDDRFIAALEMNDKTNYNRQDNNAFQVAYQVRAVTPGIYIKPGLLVEEMYAPRFFARTDSQTIEVLKSKEDNEITGVARPKVEVLEAIKLKAEAFLDSIKLEMIKPKVEGLELQNDQAKP